MSSNEQRKLYMNIFDIDNNMELVKHIDLRFLEKYRNYSYHEYKMDIINNYLYLYVAVYGLDEHLYIVNLTTPKDYKKIKVNNNNINFDQQN